MSGAAPARPLLVALRALGLGDLLVAVPALRALGRAFSGHERVLLAPGLLEPLLPLVQPGWRLLHVEGKDALDPATPPVRGPVDVAVNLHGRGPQSHALLRRLAPGRLIAFAAPGLPSAGTAGWAEDEHERERWCRLLAVHGIDADAADLELVPPPGTGPVDEDLTVLHIGAAGPSRRWPLERWAVVADSERRAGRDVVLTGTAVERPDALVVARWAGLDEVQVVAGRTGLGELVALVARAGRLVAPDTGVAHLATALRVPAVVLFGPVSPHRWGPPSAHWWQVPLWAGREGDPFAPRPDPGLLEIRPEDVLAALAALPRRAEVPRSLVRT